MIQLYKNTILSHIKKTYLRTLLVERGTWCYSCFVKVDRVGCDDDGVHGSGWGWGGGDTIYGESGDGRWGAVVQVVIYCTYNVYIGRPCR